MPENICDVYGLYAEYVNSQHTAKRAQTILSELWSAFINYALVGWGYSKMPTGRKMSQATRESAKRFMKSLPVDRVLDIRVAMQIGHEKVQRSEKMQNIYRVSVNRLIDWSVEQSWWPGSPNFGDSITNTCCTEFGRSSVYHHDQKLTHHQGRKKKYKLQLNDMPDSLRLKLDGWFSFLTADMHPERLISMKKVKPKTAEQNYIKDVLLMLGWFYNERGIEREKLSLDLLIPVVRAGDLAGLSKNESERRWQEKILYLESWLTQYRQFLTEEMQTRDNPRTFRSKLAALSSLCKYQYRSEVRFKADYERIHLLDFIQTQLALNNKAVQQRNKSKEFVADETLKWPETQPGQTALDVMQRQVLEPLRQLSLPKNKNNKFRPGSATATDLQNFIAWFFLAGMPARRQEEYRDLRISLSCPLEKPSDVPADGCYHPLPPNWLRESVDGVVADNYFYRTYRYNNKIYKEGVWVLDIHAYKTYDQYGPQSILIKNQRCQDGSRLYDYIEHYLYGWWFPGGRKHQGIYSWWQKDLIGLRGHWRSFGRAEYPNYDAVQVGLPQDKEPWVWGFFFVRPRTNTSLKVDVFSERISAAACSCIGKSVNPHLMRAIWATWAYQIGLNDQQKKSLAYAMGHDIQTLREMYQRCSPEERERPIDEAINRLLFHEYVPLEKQAPSAPMIIVSKKLERLSPEQLVQLKQVLS